MIVLAEALSGVNGEILRWAREFYNMNAEDAAKAIGVDVERYCKTLNAIVTGKRGQTIQPMLNCEKSVRSFASLVRCFSSLPHRNYRR